MERNTKQKAAVLGALCALDHPSAREVYECVQKSQPNISRGTVFRLLNSFTLSGKIRKLQLSDSDARYDKTLEPHFHARCRTCGKITDVFGIDPSLFSGAAADGFVLEGCEIEFSGQCVDCAKKNGSSV